MTRNENKKYLITKYINKYGNEKYSVAIYQRCIFWKGYYYTDYRLKGLDSIEEAKKLITKREDCLNFKEYVGGEYCQVQQKDVSGANELATKNANNHKKRENDISQVLERNRELYLTQRVSIHHHGKNLMDSYSGRVLCVDSRTVYKQNRFSDFGADDMLKFAQRCGFEDIRSFFDYYENLTDGEPFEGIIRYKDGFRWFMEKDMKTN